jgi:hypothetical protein
VRAWPVPGALPARSADPLGVGLIEATDREVRITSEALRRHVERCFAQARALDVLLKLDDTEEDRWATETALLSSEFGDFRDLISKRPRLELAIEIARPAIEERHEFQLAPGEEATLPRIVHPDSPVLLDATIEPPSGPGVARPRVWLRGGVAGEEVSAAWMLFDHPVERAWTWSQFRVCAAPERIELGEPFVVLLWETWIAPGPRELQVPELVLVAPSGRVHRLAGEPAPDSRYRLEARPDEPGLWRYGWSFRPWENSPVGSHEGEGLFFVATPSGSEEGAALRAFARRVIEDVRGKRATDVFDQYRVNAVVRWAADYEHRASGGDHAGEQAIRELREALPREIARPVYASP